MDNRFQTNNSTLNGTVEDQLENMANGVVGFLGFDSAMSNRRSKNTAMQQILRLRMIVNKQTFACGM